jgi:hypothetical protein
MPAGSAARSCCCPGQCRDGLSLSGRPIPFGAPASSKLVIAALISLDAATSSLKMSGSLFRNELQKAQGRCSCHRQSLNKGEEAVFGTLDGADYLARPQPVSSVTSRALAAMPCRWMRRFRF